MIKKAADEAAGASESVARGDFDEATLALIRATLPPELDDTSFKVFIYTCRRTGLDPLAKQIYLRGSRDKRSGKTTWTAQTGIDGYRLCADRTGRYAGNDDPTFDDEAQPAKATVTVYKVVGGLRCPFTASARWDQYYPGDAQGFMWRKMPNLMLGKCAEALALRKAFPAELSGVYIREEMDQACLEDEGRAAIKAAPPLKPQPAPEPPVPDVPMPAEPEVYDGQPHQKPALFEILRANGVTGRDDMISIAKDAIAAKVTMGALGDWVASLVHGEPEGKPQAPARG